MKKNVLALKTTQSKNTSLFKWRKLRGKMKNSFLLLKTKQSLKFRKINSRADLEIILSPEARQSINKSHTSSLKCRKRRSKTKQSIRTNSLKLRKITSGEKIYMKNILLLKDKNNLYKFLCTQLQWDLG